MGVAYAREIRVQWLMHHLPAAPYAQSTPKTRAQGVAVGRLSVFVALEWVERLDTPLFLIQALFSPEYLKPQFLKIPLL